MLCRFFCTLVVGEYRTSLEQTWKNPPRIVRPSLAVLFLTRKCFKTSQPWILVPSGSSITGTDENVLCVILEIGRSVSWHETPWRVGWTWKTNENEMRDVESAMWSLKFDPCSPKVARSTCPPSVLQRFLAQLFAVRFPSASASVSKPRIPKVIHQIWVGPKEPPCLWLDTFRADYLEAVWCCGDRSYIWIYLIC